MPRLTSDDYFAGYRDDSGITDEIRSNADNLLAFVNPMLDDFSAAGFDLPENPHTLTLVSGERDGGWRPKNCPIGAPNSAHKQGLAVDIYDPDGDLDGWLADAMLSQYGLYREDPGSTRGWCHVTIRAPHSGKRTFFP